MTDAGSAGMSAHEGELLICSVICLAAAVLFLLGVLAWIDYKRRGLRRRQRRFNDSYERTLSRTQGQGKTKPPS